MVFPSMDHASPSGPRRQVVARWVRATPERSEYLHGRRIKGVHFVAQARYALESAALSTTPSHPPGTKGERRKNPHGLAKRQVTATTAAALPR
jgi:hypothetical protein